MDTSAKKQKRQRRHKRVRAKIFGTAARPRLVVFKSNRYIYVQLVDDERGKTLSQVSSLKLKSGKKKPVDLAKETGKSIAKAALAKKIEKVAFDRGGYKYHGVIRALAEGAREEGLKF